MSKSAQYSATASSIGKAAVIACFQKFRGICLRIALVFAAQNIRERNVFQRAAAEMLEHAFGKRVESMRMAGTAVVNAAQFRMIPEEEVYFYNVFYINKVTGLFAVAVAVDTFKQFNLALGFPLVVHLEYHGCHFAFVVFLRAVNVKVTQANKLAAGFAKITAGIVIKEKFGERINIQRFFALRFFGKTVSAAAVGRSRRSVNHLNFPVCCKMH